MSEARPELRPFTFPRASEAGPTAHEPRFAAETADDLDAFEEEFADDDALAAESASGEHGEHDAVSIAGRIGRNEHESAAGELVESMLRLGQRLRGHLDTRFGAFGLSDARFAALNVIREAAPAGCTQAHLAARLGQCESSISTLVERMRASRLLYRLRAKSDRRKRVLMLTDDGRRLLDQGLTCRDHEADALFARVSEEDRKSLAEMMSRLSQTLDQADHAGRTAERPAA